LMFWMRPRLKWTYFWAPLTEQATRAAVDLMVGIAAAAHAIAAARAARAGAAGRVERSVQRITSSPPPKVAQMTPPSKQVGQRER
jgi:hypothetical protein